MGYNLYLIMDLYNLKNKKLTQIDSKPFNLEKDIQKVVEENTQELFNLQYVTSEFSLGDFRIDTLCFDEEYNSFVIIEYKKGKSYSVIDQGYSYLSLMLNNKSDFILEYNENKKNNLKRGDVDWGSSKVIFLSPSFNTYQKNSVNFKDVPFELWEIKRFSNNTIGLDQHISTSKESIQKIDSSKDSVIRKVGKEVKVYEENDQISKCSKSLIENWNKLKEYFSNLEGVEIVPKRSYISLMIGKKNVSFFNFRKETILIELLRGQISPDGTKSKNYFNLDDPKKVSKESGWKWKSGTKGKVYKILFDKNSDTDYIMFLINQKYKNLTN